jgi:hypothetical protein
MKNTETGYNRQEKLEKFSRYAAGGRWGQGHQAKPRL